MCQQVSRIPKWQQKGVVAEAHTAINTEWGRYSSTLLPRVQEDLDLDAETGNLKGKNTTSHLSSSPVMKLFSALSGLMRQPAVCMLRRVVA
jgi:hexokinase